MDVLGVEGGDDVEVSGIRRVATEFGFGFLVVPVMCGSRIVWDTGVSRGWGGDNHVDGEVGRGSDVGFGEVGRVEVEADVSGAGEVVGDEVTGFDGDAVA